MFENLRSEHKSFNVDLAPWLALKCVIKDIKIEYVKAKSFMDNKYNNVGIIGA